MARITSEKRKEILKSVENGEKVVNICKKYCITRPTLLKIRNESESLRSESESDNEDDSVNIESSVNFSSCLLLSAICVKKSTLQEKYHSEGITEVDSDSECE